MKDEQFKAWFLDEARREILPALERQKIHMNAFGMIKEAARSAWNASKAALPSLKEELAVPAISDPTPAGWRCFGCDFYTTDYESAQAHFGERDDPEECKPICKWWDRLSEDERIGQLQDALHDLSYERMEAYKSDKRADAAESELNRLRALAAKGEWIKREDLPLDIQHTITECAKNIISTEAKCIEWGAPAGRSVELAEEAISNLLLAVFSVYPSPPSLAAKREEPNNG